MSLRKTHLCLFIYFTYVLAKVQTRT